MMKKLHTKRTKKPHRKLPKILSVDLLDAILDQSPETVFEVRDAAMCELFYSSGLRLSELTNLNYSELDLDVREVRVINGAPLKTPKNSLPSKTMMQ